MGETITLKAEDGQALGAYRAAPDGEAKGSVVVVQEIFGVNDHIRTVADGYAQAGYLAVAPALFDRLEPGLELTYDDDGVARGRALRTQLAWHTVLLDVAAAVREAATAGRVGVVGYCWGGSVAWYAASKLPIAAAVGYYGGQIHDLIDATPRVPTMLHFGAQDDLIPKPHVDAVMARHPDVAILVYGAGHGFNCDARSSYDELCARVARERTLRFFDDNLVTYESALSEG